MGRRSFDRELALFEKLAGTGFLPTMLEERRNSLRIEARRRTADDAKRKLEILYRRRGMPDVGYMNSPSFVEEYELFNLVVRMSGTTCMSRRLYRRYLKVDRERRLRAGTTTNW